MDTAVISAGSGVVVPVKYTYVSGGGSFLYTVPASSPLMTAHVFVAQFVIDYPIIEYYYNHDSQLLLRDIYAGNSTYAQTYLADTKVLHIVSNGSHVCISLYRFANAADPCTISPLLPAAPRIAPYSDFTMLSLATKPNAIVGVQLQVFTATLNATITVNGIVQPQRLAIAILAADIISGLRYGGTGLLLGGNGSLSIESIERKSISFWCDPAEQPYTLGYCLAPSMHMCKDFHYRPECKPAPNCNHGKYDPMQHMCLCDNNYAGAYCELQICTPACVFGDCEENNVCSCWENIYGQRCEQYRTNNVTNNTAAGNMTIFSGAVIVVSYANNNTYLTVLGTVFIENGTSVVLVVNYVPRIGDRVTILAYGRHSGQFDKLYVAGSNIAPFPRCLNYTIEYGEHTASAVFIDGCAEQDLPVPWYATVSVLASVFAVITVFILLARYNQRFRAFLLPFRRHLHRYYRIVRPGVVINDSDSESADATPGAAPAKNHYQSLTEITAKETRRDPVSIRSPPGYTKIQGADIIESPKDQQAYGKTEIRLQKEHVPVLPVVANTTEDVNIIDIPSDSGKTTTVTFVSGSDSKD